MKKLLVPLSGYFGRDDPEQLDRPALEAAFTIAGELGAHVEVLCITDTPPSAKAKWPVLAPGYGVNQLIETIEAQNEVRRKHARAAYVSVRGDLSPAPRETRAPESGFTTNYIEHAGEVREIVGKYGRLADMIVIASSKVRWEAPFRPMLEASLQQAGRPVFVTPITPPKTFGAKVAIAWNDTVESARAVTASLELLKRAGRTTVISCAESRANAPDPKELVDYLSWHEVSADAVALKNSSKKSAPAIVSAALDAGCDLLIMGAHMRTRSHVLFFGSMTEYVLNEPKIATIVVS